MNWTENETRILVENYGKIKMGQLMALLPGRTAKAIGWQAQQRKLYANRHITNRRLDFSGDGYFHVPAIKNSYWAGFIAADGCVDGIGVLYLYQADVTVIERFKACIAWPGSIYTRTRPNGSVENCVCVTSKQMVADLAHNFNIVKAKSLILQPPAGLSRECSLAYITGLLDGDGSISIVNEHSDEKRPYLATSITGTKEVLEWVRQVIGLNLAIHRRTDCKSEVYRLAATHKKAREMLATLLSVGELQGLRLSRKWNKVQQFNTWI